MSSSPAHWKQTSNTPERRAPTVALPPSAVQRILAEPAFLRTLSLERKRAERSRKPFVLMLVDGRSSLPGAVRAVAVGKTMAPILSSVRETDVVGWYKDQTTLGVLFPELGGADQKVAVKALHTKVTSALQAVLGDDETAQIRVSFYCFPDDDGDDDRRPPAKVYPDLAERDREIRAFRAVKRTIDIAGSALLLVLLAPLLITIAVAVKLTSPGPVLFRQRRVGQHGIPFTFLKFRSMRVNNDAEIHRQYVTRLIAWDVNGKGAGHNGNAVFKITNDPRVTRLGRFLRKTSLDELPQLLNVVAGTMSLVGPRPPVPYEYEAYDVWHRRRVLEAKPGITGLWQVNGRSRLRFDDMVRLDLRYAEAASLWLDLKILLRTPAAVLSGNGAY